MNRSGSDLVTGLETLLGSGGLGFRPVGGKRYLTGLRRSCPLTTHNCQVEGSDSRPR
jgi:hypothetical protein